MQTMPSSTCFISALRATSIETATEKRFSRGSPRRPAFCRQTCSASSCHPVSTTTDAAATTSSSRAVRTSFTNSAASTRSPSVSTSVAATASTLYWTSSVRTQHSLRSPSSHTASSQCLLCCATTTATTRRLPSPFPERTTNSNRAKDEALPIVRGSENVFMWRGVWRGRR